MRWAGRDKRDRHLAVEQGTGLAGRGLSEQFAQLRFGLAGGISRNIPDATRLRLGIDGEAKAFGLFADRGPSKRRSPSVRADFRGACSLGPDGIQATPHG